jgi:hypothetical protein
MLPPQPLRDLLWRPIVIELGRDQPRQLGIASELAHLQTARPVECRSIGRHHGHRCERSPWTPSTRAGQHDGRSITRSGPLRSPGKSLHAQSRSNDWPDVAAEPEESHPTGADTAGSQAVFHQACAPVPNRITATPHRPQQVLMLDTELDRPHGVLRRCIGGCYEGRFTQALRAQDFGVAPQQSTCAVRVSSMVGGGDVQRARTWAGR